MRALQKQIVEEMGVAAQIEPAEEVERRVRFLSEYALTTGAKSLVLGISGGVDSTLAGRLGQMAAEHLRADGHDVEFIAMRLPHGQQSDEDDVVAALGFIGPDQAHEVNIEPTVTGFDESYRTGVGHRLLDFHRGNVKARTRMLAQYAAAGETGGLVLGTDQASESTVGYFTKFGDGGADLLPLYTLNKRQVRQMLEHLGAPEKLWTKVATADLLDDDPGLSDEEEMGVRYDDLDDYLEGRDVPEQAALRIEELYTRSRHKRATPVTITHTWWQEADD